MRNGADMRVILGLGLLACVAQAAPPEGAFPKSVKLGERELRLNGCGLCEYGVFAIDLYWGALYLEQETSEPQKAIDSKQAKRIHLYFVRQLTQQQMRDAWTYSFERNAGKRMPVYRERVNQLNAMMRTIKVGESLIFTIVPGEGVRVELGGKQLGVIKGDDFGTMLMTLYLGPKPPDPGLRAGMLGR